MSSFPLVFVVINGQYQGASADASVPVLVLYSYILFYFIPRLNLRGLLFFFTLPYVSVCLCSTYCVAQTRLILLYTFISCLVLSWSSLALFVIILRCHIMSIVLSFPVLLRPDATDRFVFVFVFLRIIFFRLAMYCFVFSCLASFCFFFYFF